MRTEEVSGTWFFRPFERLRRARLGIALALCTLAFATNLRAQQLEIRGSVRDSSGAPLAGSAVMVQGTGRAAVTGDDGHFSIVVPEGFVHGQSETIVALLIGYAPDSARVRFMAGSIVRDFVLRIRPLVMGSVITFTPDSFNTESKELAADYGDEDPAALESAGLTSLRATHEARRRREIRIWTGISIGIPKLLYRFVQDGRAAHGELIYYWNWSFDPSDSVWSGYRNKLQTTAPDWCTQMNFEGSMWTCRARFAPPINWDVIWKSLGDAGVFAPHDYSLLKSPYGIETDGPLFTIETWDGKSYHRWTPRLGNSTEEFARGDTLGQILSRLANRTIRIP